MVSTLEEMQKCLNNGTCDKTDNGKCTQCGGCCSNLLPMTDKEIEVIHKYIKRYHIKEYKHLIPLAQPVIDMTCPFLNDDKPTEKCMIYEVRPQICKSFICRPSLRPKLDLKYGLQARIVNVREEFFGDNL